MGRNFCPKMIAQVKTGKKYDFWIISTWGVLLDSLITRKVNRKKIEIFAFALSLLVYDLEIVTQFNNVLMLMGRNFCPEMKNLLLTM